MSNTKILCLGAAALMLAFYLSKRNGGANQGRAGYVFDGYGWVPANGSYVYR